MWLAQHDALRPKLHGVYAADMLGARKPQDIASSRVVAECLDGAALDLARIAWDAFRMPTPEEWFALLDRNLDVFPALRGTVRSLLAELPDARTGVTAAQLGLLRSLQPGPMTVDRLLAEAPQGLERVCDYWSLGRLLVDLGCGETPLIDGLGDEAFDMALHDDRDRHRRFLQRTVSLSPLGQRVAEGRANFAAHGSIDRWWGGTHLTKRHLWRWDAVGERLIEPAG